METTFILIFILFPFFQTYNAISNNIMVTNSSNITCIPKERQSLVVFKQGLTDESNRLSTWTGVKCCEWEGVGCDKRNGHVVKLDLRSPLSFIDYYISSNTRRSWLKGKVSPSLLNLKYLRYLDLSMNNFTGQNIPEFFGSFKYLEYLNLSFSGFSGVVPPHLGNLSRLEYLDLHLLYRYDMVPLSYDVSLMVKDDLQWMSLLSSLKHLDFSGITIGNHIDWFHPINMLPSLLTLNLALCDINLSFIKFINFTSLNSLDLSFNGINSTFPVWLSNLSSLEHLNLEKNNFHGRISDFIGTLSSLSSIELSSNQLSGPIPPSLSGLSSLRVLDLSMNQLSGPIPRSLGGLSSLRVLDLSMNQLSSPIPRSLGGLSSLRVLDLSRNQLSGSIPKSIGQMSMLEELQLSVNHLSGGLPKSIGLLTRLHELSLYINQLSGSIPTSLGELSSLFKLDVSYNSLDGVLSEIHFMKLNNLVVLDLSENSITFNVSPNWIPLFQLNYFRASSCNIGPQFPNWLQTSTYIIDIHLSNSGIRDSIPEWFENITFHLGFLDLSENKIGGNLPRMRNPGIVAVNLAQNLFNGSVPTHLCEWSSIRLLDLSNNNFSGVLPKCVGNLIHLQVMDIKNNTLTGDVPSSLGFLSNLESLHLSNNKFKGNLPVALQNLTRLVTCDLGKNLLTGDIPSWIGNKLSKLRILNLQSNNFMGKIPPKLCQNNALQHLNLANNNISGMIPHCIYNLTGMIVTSVDFQYYASPYEENIESYIKGIQLKYTKTLKYLTSIDFSSNQIIGEIPDVLMNLAALNNLNLSRNLLSGQIPTRIGNLNKLESLDFSMNLLSGGIPQSLATLNFLSYLNLSFNNLSGQIPFGSQLQTLGDPLAIYGGNNELCGPILLRSCNRKSLPDTHVSDEDGNIEIEDFWLLITIIPGFVVGFMGFIGSLYFIKEWRLVYFETIENVYSWLVVWIIVTLTRIQRKIF
uniref:receptor-like protein EIX2 n=1 Tax=Erigeron canadensis TaxID=72917 RepID=UPI001CB91F42|nr:receptor-like protein EIX2 [Erigeron canadensis]